MTTANAQKAVNKPMFGINVNLDESLQNRVKMSKDVGINHYRICVSLDAKVSQVKKISKNLGDSSCYIILLQASEDIFHDWDKKIDKVMKLLGAFKKKQVAGVNLIYNVHNILRRGQNRVGIPRDEIVFKLNKLSKAIKNKKFSTVMHMRQDDIESGLWESLDYDIVDLDFFVSKNSKPFPSIKKRVWAGRAGVWNGVRISGVQKTTVRKLNDILSECELIFLWSSEKDSKRFEWFKDGGFILTAQEMGLYNKKV